MMPRDRARGAPAAPAFKLAFPADRRQHSDRDLYVVWVLWVTGYTALTIGNVVGLRRQQVLNIITKSDYSNRSAMTDQQRRRLLQELKDIRMDDGFPIDGGRLNRISWEIQPLTDGRKRRPARKAVAP